MSVVLSRNWSASNTWPASNASRSGAGWYSKAGRGNNVAFRSRTTAASGGFVLKRSQKQTSRNGKVNVSSMLVVMVGCLVAAGAFYLYQVNNISIKGYEIKAIESRIQDLQKENQKLKIREVESRSMYNIEKNTENLNLVNSANVTYVEMRGPVAMK